MSSDHDHDHDHADDGRDDDDYHGKPVLMCRNRYLNLKLLMMLRFNCEL